MNQRVKIYNDNAYPFKSTFKGDPVEIAAKEFWMGTDGKPREFDLFEANDFRGDYHQPMRDGQGLPDPKSFKVIKLVPIDGTKVETVEAHVCMQCKHKSPSPEELEAHIKVKHADVERLSEDEVKTAQFNKKARA